MELKILHSADWHMDTPFDAFHDDQREYLQAAQRKIPQKIAEVCREEKCDLVLLAGDLFDTSWTQESLKIVQDAMEDCRIPVLITPGNHDPWGTDSPWEKHWPGNVCVFPPEISTLDFTDLDCRIYGAGFASMDSPSMLEDFHTEPGPKWQIGLFHGDPLGGGSNYNPVTGTQIRDSGLDYLALGHIHTMGNLEIDGTVCGWPGCPMGRGWEDIGQKGCLIVTFEDKVKLRPVYLDSPRFYEQTVEINGNAVETLEKLLPSASRDFFRITLTGCAEVNISRLYRQFSAFPNLELRDRTVNLTELWAQAGEDSLQGVYFQQLKDAAERANPEERKIILLAAELSKRILEGREVQIP